MRQLRRMVFFVTLVTLACAAVARAQPTYMDPSTGEFYQTQPNGTVTRQQDAGAPGLWSTGNGNYMDPTTGKPVWTQPNGNLMDPATGRELWRVGPGLNRRPRR